MCQAVPDRLPSAPQADRQALLVAQQSAPESPISPSPLARAAQASGASSKALIDPNVPTTPITRSEAEQLALKNTRESRQHTCRP